jgi:hypothetical protein
MKAVIQSTEIASGEQDELIQPKEKNGSPSRPVRIRSTEGRGQNQKILGQIKKFFVVT